MGSLVVLFCLFLKHYNPESHFITMRVQEIQKIELQVRRGETSSYAFVLSTSEVICLCIPGNG